MFSRNQFWSAAALVAMTGAISPALAFAQGTVTNYFPLSPPCRLVDTRNAAGTFGGPQLSSLQTRTFPVPQGSCAVPSTAIAYAMNVAVVPNGPLPYLTVWPTGQPRPAASNLNDPQGVVASNFAIVLAGTNGSINVYNYSSYSTDLIIDIQGYYTSPSVSMTQSTALGAGASSAGAQNTAVGYNALAVNNTGNANTATGTSALSNDTTGGNNTGIGAFALAATTSGAANTGVGSQVLLNDSIGNENTALGYSALWGNTVGNYNTALGLSAMFNNDSGSYNTAVGGNALYAINSGASYNIAVGYQAGNQLVNGSNNIDIGNTGTGSDSNSIRIGTQNTHLNTYIAGISGTGVSNGASVVVNSSGQLGVVLSSMRYKEDVHDIGDASDALMQLRPVTFRYKRPADDGSKPLHYGLIAEDVAEIFPDLVVTGENGEPESVAYHELPALLLNEIQKQRKAIYELQERISGLEKRLQQAENERLR